MTSEKLKQFKVICQWCKGQEARVLRDEQTNEIKISCPNCINDEVVIFYDLILTENAGNEVKTESEH